MIKKNSLILFSFCFLLSTFYFSGCGYTTRGFIDPQYQSVYVQPVVNKVKVTGETQEFGDFRSVPAFLDQAFTRALIARFNLDGHLRVTKEENADLIVECTITDYKQGTLRYDNDDRVEEYRLKLYYTYRLLDSVGDVVKKGRLVANSEYALVGAAARSEEQAIAELLEDASRRLVDAIIEEW